MGTGHPALVALFVFGERFAGPNEFGTSVLVSIGALFLGMFGRNNSRNIIQCQGILIAKGQFSYCFAIGVLLFDNLKSMAPRVCAITARRSRPCTSPLRSVDYARRTRFFVCGRQSTLVSN